MINHTLEIDCNAAEARFQLSSYNKLKLYPYAELSSRLQFALLKVLFI